MSLFQSLDPRMSKYIWQDGVEAGVISHSALWKQAKSTDDSTSWMVTTKRTGILKLLCYIEIRVLVTLSEHLLASHCSSLFDYLSGWSSRAAYYAIKSWHRHDV
jgi:hypothetical protein